MKALAESACSYPEGPAAVAPPESRGLARDEVRLLVAAGSEVTHARFHDLPRFLSPGDLVVVNTSATLPAALDGARNGDPVGVHFSTRLDDGSWVVELRRPDIVGSGPLLDGTAGEEVEVTGGGLVRILGAYRGVEGRSRLLRGRLNAEGSPGVSDYLLRFGRPITYGYISDRWPLEDYQTIFASEPGSAEMPSAGRPFTDRLVTELVVKGVAVAPILLHTGVSSPELGESPAPERFRVPEATAALVNLTRSIGGRVIAVGTTVARALEAAAANGRVRAAEGWTELVLDRARPAEVVDGLVTGWHAASASHLDLLEAVAGEAMVHRAYDAAAAAGYLWHEFGDSCLLLPERRLNQVR